jgi:hypothetical protein
MRGPDARAQVESPYAVASTSARSHVFSAPSHASRETGGGASPYADTPAGQRAAILTASSRRASRESEREGVKTDSGGSKENRERQNPILSSADFNNNWSQQPFSRGGHR